MKISQCRFVISAVSPAQYPDDHKPEIALAGRSNVGKSSLTNMLINRNGLAKTSSTPGKTQTINFYDIDDQFRFVDLPGYGYAKVSKSQRGTWGKIIETYLNKRENLLEVCLLIDMRHKPSDDDVLMYEWIKSCGFMGIVIGTKSDKLKRSQLKPQEKLIRETLGMTREDVFLPASAETRDGKYQIWDFLNRLFEERNCPIYFERQIGEPNHEKALEIALRAKALAEESADDSETFNHMRHAPIHNAGNEQDENQYFEDSEENYDEGQMSSEVSEETTSTKGSRGSSRAMISSQLNIPKGFKNKK